ncbi:hypothetical protein [Saccharothrix lopnurensis]|uniref:Uncharacterized protein n=1 Tax=Saccharothrix lopnurensis TaxID=1670621 RepID=A0ABW1PEA7_9PSEU
MTKFLFEHLWGQPASRRRWSRPHRTEQSVHAVAKQIAWIAAANMEATVPFEDLASVIEQAVLADLRGCWAQDPSPYMVALSRPTGRILGWFIEYKPSRAPALFGGIVRQARHLFDMPQEVLERALIRAVVMDGEVEDGEERVREFFAVAFPPAK